MRRRDLLWLFLLSLAVRLGTALYIHQPGYMDAYYYTVGAWQLAEGRGFSEPFIWNYLDDPTGLPHPGFLYWMPLPSDLAAPFAALFPDSFFAVQFPFALLSALLPLVGYTVAWRTTGQRRHAWAVGLLALFNGFFFPYWTLPESFAPFALFGSLALLLAGCWILDTGYWMLDAGRWLLVGLLAGLAHLTRADGILLLPVVALASLIRSKSRPTQHVSRFTFHVSRLTLIILGYLLPMAPWFVRNLVVIGAPLSSAGAKTLWLTTYDDLFCYGCDLSLRSYLAWGWGNILRSKLWALGVNLERFLAEDCLVFLFPFVLFGLYRLRRRPPFILSLIYLFLIYLAHSVAFTFPGPRGGLFHASGALMPFLFTGGVVGLDEAVAWAARRRRGWDPRVARAFFTCGCVGLAVGLSLLLFARQVPGWNRADAVYAEIGAWLRAQTDDSTIVMVGNPPGFYYHGRWPSVVVPNGGEEVLGVVAERYGVGYLVLDQNRPVPLADFYNRRGGEGWTLLAEMDGGRVQVYRRTDD